VAERCDYVLPQAYSVNRSGKVYRPGVTQTEAYKRWRDFWVTYWDIRVWRKPIVMGLAAWNLNRPGGMSRTRAMQVAIETTEDLSDPSISEVAYWSLQWAIRSKERAAFIRQAGAKARQGVSQRAKLEPEMGIRVV